MTRWPASCRLLSAAAARGRYPPAGQAGQASQAQPGHRAKHRPPGRLLP